MRKRRIAVIGGGIIGASVAAQLTSRSESNHVTLFEKETEPAAHQTGHNSGVVHAGLYYAPGSLKALLTRRGVGLLREFCEVRSVRYEECGKLVIANTASQRAELQSIFVKAKGNGVPGVTIVERDRMRDIEPHCEGVSAIYSPHTAIVDYPGVTLALLDDVRRQGGTIRLGVEVLRIDRTRGEQRLITSQGTESFQYVIACNGLQSDRLARRSGASRYPEIVPFSGDYYRLTHRATRLVRGLVYPVPDPAYPFLGVHLTPTVDSDVLVGPNAFLSFAREHYRRPSFSLPDAVQIAGSGAFWRFASRNVGQAIEQLRTASKRSFVEGAQAFIPELTAADLVRRTRGVRAQALNADGTLEDDFVIQRVDNTIFVRNAPSPAATSAMAIAEHIIDGVFGGGPSVVARAD